MCRFKVIYFVIFILNLYGAHSTISDKRLCFDAECKEPVSKAKTLLRYNSPYPKVLSFMPNEDVLVYSKEAGSKADLWGVEIRGKRGYAPKSHLRETRILKKPQLIVDTELPTPQVPVLEKESITPNVMQKPYEVVDGTKIYLTPEEINNSTESPLLSTTTSSVDIKTDKIETAPLEANNKEKTIPSIKSDNNNQETLNTEKQNDEKSIVDSVLSDLSAWINEKSDENDDDDDIEDAELENEEEDEDEEENDFDRTTNNTTKGTEDEITQSQSEHETNLPPSLKISSSSLEVDSNAVVSEDNITNQVDSINELEDVPKVPIEVVKTVPEENLSSSSEPLQPPEDSKLDQKMFIEKTEPETLSPEILSNTPFEKVIEVPKSTMDIEKINSGEKPLQATKDINLQQEMLLNDKTIQETLPVELKNPQTLSNKPSEENIRVPKSIIDIEELNSGSEPVKPPQDLKIEKEMLNEKTAQETLIVEQIHENEKVKVESGESSDLKPQVDLLGIMKQPFTEEIKNMIPNEPVLENDIPALTGDNVEVKQTVQEQINVGEVTKNGIEANDDNSEPSYSTYSLSSEQEITKEQEEKEKLEDIAEMATPPSLDTDTMPIFIDITPDPGKVQEIIEDDDEHEDVSLPPLAALSESTGLPLEDDNMSKIEAVPQEQNFDNLNQENPQESSVHDEIKDEENAEGFMSGISSIFGSMFTGTPEEENEAKVDETKNTFCYPEAENCNQKDLLQSDTLSSEPNQDQFVLSETEENISSNYSFNSDIFIYLVTTAISVILFMLGYIALDRSRKEAPLVAKINKLEQQLLVSIKENEILKNSPGHTEDVPNKLVDQLTQQVAELEIAKTALEEQVQALEKELDTSTEVGMELNKLISEMLNSSNGSDTLKESVEQMQRQLLDQQDTINTVNETLNLKETENHELHLELEISNKKVSDLQTEVDKMVEKILKIEEERDQQQGSLESEILMFQKKYKDAVVGGEHLSNEIQVLRTQFAEAQREVEIKVKEYKVLKESLNDIKSLKNNSDALKSLLDVSSVKAQLDQLKTENVKYAEQLQKECDVKTAFEKRCQSLMEEITSLRENYEQADKEKVEINTKLDVLNNYFKEKETQMQKEISKYESLWAVKEGEATSTTERIKYMQEELQNSKSQNESLKQEIMNQEVELKSQISVLEKKVHDMWVTNRQTERKLEDARQEAAQLRNRLTMRERSLQEGHAQLQNRMQSPLHQNGEIPLSPPPIESPVSPALLFGGRDHLTKSPPIPGLPPPFLPPPPGAPFMPPPIPGMPPFMPPPPNMFPGDHRPPPLGRMSSPPLNSRYSPESTIYSEYDRNSGSPTYDSEYGTSPPGRSYNPYSRDDRRDYKRSHVRSNGRNGKGSGLSSTSDHSNDSIGKSRKHNNKV